MRPPPMKCTMRSWCSASRPPPRRLRVEPRTPPMWRASSRAASIRAGAPTSTPSSRADAPPASAAPGGGPVLWCAAERLAEIEAALGGGRADPPLALPEELRTASWTRRGPGRSAARAARVPRTGDRGAPCL